MKLLLSTNSLPHYGLVRSFEFAQNAGFDGMEITISDNLDTQNADYIKRVATETDMQVLAIRLGGISTLTKIQHAITLARDIGVQSLILPTPPFLDFKAKEWINFQLAKTRAHENFAILFENPPSTNIFGIVPKMSFNNFQDLADLGDFALDTSYVYAKKASLIKIWNSLKDKIEYITLANFRDGQDHTLPMDGILPINNFLTHVASHRYDGPIAINVLPHELEEGTDERVVSNLIDTVKFTKRFFTAKAAEPKADTISNNK